MTEIVYTNDLGVTRTEPFGIDVSMHNGAVDMAKVRAHAPKITFAWAKTGESWGYEDPKFDEYRAKFEDDGIWFGGYHFFYPAEDPKAQVRKFIEIGGKTLAGYAWDMEIWQGQPASVALKNAGIAIMEMLNMGLPVWIYTNQDGVNNHLVPYPLQVPGWFADVNWWIAQVLSSGKEHAGPIAELRGVPRERILIHQSAWKWRGSLIGQVGSYHLDGNRWLRGAPGEIPEVEEEVPVDPPIVVPEGSYQVISAAGLNVRDVPIGMPGSQVINWLAKGTVVKPIELVTIGEDVWARLSEWSCCAVRYKGTEFLG